MKHFFSHYFAIILNPFVQIRAGERLKTALMFSYFFLIIALNWMLKPVQKSLYISAFGAEKLKFANIAEGVFLILVVSAYMWVARKASRKVFYYGVLLFFMTSFVAFWVLFNLKVPYLPAFFFLWQASFTITMTTAFWTLANDIFNTTEAKRLFGIMISGGSLGGVVGSLITRNVVNWVRTEDILLIAAGMVFLCFIVVRVLLKSMPAQDKPALSVKTAKVEEKHAPETTENLKDSAVKLFLSSKYLLLLAGVVIISKMASTIVDNQFSGVVENSISGKDAMTAFFGQFGVWVNSITFVMQFFATSLFLRYLGVGFSIWILPVGLSFLSIVTILNPVLLTGVIFRIFDLSANYSVQQASKEVFYLPVSSTLRRRVKPLIDMLCYRASKSFAGILMWAAALLFSLPVEKLGWLILGLAPLWLYLAWKLKVHYADLLRDHLKTKTDYRKVVDVEQATDVLGFLYDEKTFQAAKPMMHKGSAAVRKVVSTSFLTYANSAHNLEATRAIMNQMIHEDILEDANALEQKKSLSETDVKFLQSIISNSIKDAAELEDHLKTDGEQVLMKLSGILRDVSQDVHTKISALRILERIPGQQSVDLLLQALAASRNHTLRFVMIGILERKSQQEAELQFNRFLIKNEVTREIKVYDKVKKLKAFYENELENKNGEDSLLAALSALQDESLARVFRYLGILYRDEMIFVIYDEITSSEKDTTLRAHAVELLNNIVEPNLAFFIQRALDFVDADNLKQKDITQILNEFAESEDNWYKLTSNFLVTQLNLDKKWRGLESIRKNS